MLVDDNVVPITVRGVEPRNPFLTVRDSSSSQKHAILEPAPHHRAAANRGTLLGYRRSNLGRGASIPPGGKVRRGRGGAPARLAERPLI